MKSSIAIVLVLAMVPAVALGGWGSRTSDSSAALAQAEQNFADAAAGAVLRARAAAAARRADERRQAQAAMQRGDCASASAIAAKDRQMLAYVRSNCTLQAREQRVARDVAAFATDPSHPLFQDVRDDMERLLRAGRAKDLQQAYDTAVDSNLELRGFAQAAPAGSAAAPAQAWPVSTEPSLTGAPTLDQVKAWTRANIQLVGWAPLMQTATSLALIQTVPPEPSGPGRAKLWMRFEFYDRSTYAGIVIRSMRQQIEIDCTRQMTRPLLWELYPFLNLKGPTVTHASQNESWDSTRPKTLADAVLADACPVLARSS